MKIKLFTIVVLIAALSSCGTAKPKNDADVFIIDPRSSNIVIGEVEFQIDTLLGLGSLKKYTAEVSYYPREDAVCVQFREGFMTYRQFWSRSGRQLFIEALRQYNENYDSRTLEENSRNSRNSKRIYGITKGYLIWQQFQYTIQAKANMNVELGYSFDNRSPYFTVYQREAEYIAPKDQSRDSNRTSNAMTLFYTRAQAAGLAALFDQQLLDELGKGYKVQTPSGADRDDY